MYINTFKYTPKDVSCQLCTEYVKKLGCTALRCPWLAERIEAGVVGYREAVMETFPRDRRLSSRLNLLIKHYPGSLWSNEQHERRMQYQCAVQGYRRRRDTNAYYAAMYLLTSTRKRLGKPMMPLFFWRTMGSARAISWCSTMADAPRMDHKQLRRSKKLIRKLCCNYDHGNCLALDDGEPCVCVQGISYSLLCNWFRNAVLPADHELLADVMRERPGKCCAVCGKPVYSSSNRAKYCPACAKQERRKQDAKRKREQYWNLRR